MLSLKERILIGAAAAATAIYFVPGLNPFAYVVVSVSYILLAYAVATVAYLKGRPVFAAAGIGSVAVPAVITAIGRWEVSRLDGGPPAYGSALLYFMVELWVGGALLLTASIGAAIRVRPDSRWEMGRRGAGRALQQSTDHPT